MKNIICILTIISFLSGCDSNSFLEKIGLKEKVTNIIQIRNEIAYLPNSDKPFTGKLETLYPNGRKQEERYFKNGKSNGIQLHWYESGQKKDESYFKDNMRSGLSTEWYPNGQKSYECSYKDDKKDGLYTLWYPDGQKGAEGSFKDDKNITPSVLEAIDDLKNYANGFVETAKLNMFNPKVVEVKEIDTKINIFNPEAVEVEVEDEDHFIRSYTIIFKTSDPELINKNVSYKASIKDTAIEIEFREKFCTTELKPILSKHEIGLVLIDFVYDKGRVNKENLKCYSAGIF